MPSFTFNGVDRTGSPVRGDVEALNEKAALEQLSRQGILPVELNDAARFSTQKWWQREIELFGANRPTQDLIRFFKAFSVVLEAKIPIAKAFGFAERQAKTQTLKVALSRINLDVANGSGLSEAMEKWERVFGNDVLAIIRIGESSNTLSSAVLRCSDMLTTGQAIRSEIRNAMIYPAILMVMSAGVLGLILFYLLPTLEPVFANSGADLPTAFVVMTKIRDILVDYWPGLVIGVIVLAALIPVLRKSGAYEQFINRLWVIGTFRRDIQNQRIVQTIAVMLQSGSPLPEALDLASASISKTDLAHDLLEARQSVIGGADLSTSLRGNPRIAPIVNEMIEVGEESDRLPELLASAGEALEASIKSRIDLALKITTPVLTLAIGLIVGGMVLSTISAVMTINDIAL